MILGVFSSATAQGPTGEFNGWQFRYAIGPGVDTTGTYFSDEVVDNWPFYENWWDVPRGTGSQGFVFHTTQRHTYYIWEKYFGEEMETPDVFWFHVRNMRSTSSNAGPLIYFDLIGAGGKTLPIAGYVAHDGTAWARVQRNIHPEKKEKLPSFWGIRIELGFHNGLDYGWGEFLVDKMIVHYNAPISQSVVLDWFQDGVDWKPVLSLEPRVVDFYDVILRGEEARRILIKNPGGNKLEIENVLTPTSGEFSVNLEKDEVETFGEIRAEITFKPNSPPGERNEHIYFHHNGRNSVDTLFVRGIVYDPTSVEKGIEDYGFALSNYPNPFNPETMIEFSLPERMFVDLSVFDIRGRKIETLLFGEKETGVHRIIWDASKHPDGIYLYRIKGGDFSSTRKMILLK